jgi:hypothetical protein
MTVSLIRYHIIYSCCVCVDLRAQLAELKVKNTKAEIAGFQLKGKLNAAEAKNDRLKQVKCRYYYKLCLDKLRSVGGGCLACCV